MQPSFAYSAFHQPAFGLLSRSFPSAQQAGAVYYGHGLVQTHFSGVDKPDFKKFRAILPMDSEYYRLNWKEKLFYRYFVKKYGSKIQVGRYKRDEMPWKYQGIVNNLPTKPVVLIDIGTSVFKVLWAQREKDIVYYKIPMPKLALEKKPSSPFRGINLFFPLIINRVSSLDKAVKFRHKNRSKDIKYLTDIFRFIDLHCKLAGLHQGLNSPQVMKVATEGFRGLLENEVNSKKFLDKFDVEIITPHKEALLTHSVLVADVRSQIADDALTVDIGGGSTDCAYYSLPEASKQKIEDRERLTLHYKLGTRRMVEVTEDVFNHDQLWALEDNIRPIIIEALQNNPLKRQLSALLCDLGPVVQDYAKSMNPETNLFPKNNRYSKDTPISRDDLKKRFLSQKALDFYRQHPSSGDVSAHKQPVRLLILWVLMDELNIPNLYQGGSGGMKFALLDEWTQQNRQLVQ